MLTDVGGALRQPTVYCASCGACNVGAENACASGGFVGLSGAGGGMSEEVVMPEISVMVFRLIEGIGRGVQA